MVHIVISKGLDIPIQGRPERNSELASIENIAFLDKPQQIALDFTPFSDMRFSLHVKVGDSVKIGQPIAEDRSSPGRLFVSPAAGMVQQIRRGDKRVLTDVIIDVAEQEQWHIFDPLDISHTPRESIIERLLIGGLFAHIYTRPLKRLAEPYKIPRSIFVKALESAPFVPPAELQVAGHERAFQIGLDALAKLTSGKVHLVHAIASTAKAFIEAKNVEKHTAEGPHPIANQSLHIQRIDPIESAEDIVWTVTAHDVVMIGYILLEGRYHIDRTVGIAGPAVLPEDIGFFRGRMGYPIAELLSGRVSSDSARLISGDPLMGMQVDNDSFLGFSHFTTCAIPECEERQFLHFFRLGLRKYSFSKAYLSGHLDNSKRDYFFTTSVHGEKRAFVDSTLYDAVMPLAIATMPLVKAVMAEDFELAHVLGLLDVDSEDFALPTFVCPSKMEMVQIMEQGIKRYAKDVLSV
jgi:Na+-transporting NADH:ubiquinone oxidoreductase subunit A